MKVIALFIPLLLGGIYCLLGYWLVFKPERYLKWISWSWKGFGIRPVIEDEAKFRRSHRFLGISFFILGISFSMWLLWVQ